MKVLMCEIKNEIIKLYSGRIIIAIVVCIVLFCFFNIFNQLNTQYSDDWHLEVQEEIKLNEEILTEIRGEIDDNTYQNHLLQNEKLKYYLNNNICPNTTVLQFVHDAIDLNFVLILLSILIFSKVFCVEKSSGTEKIYLTRNVKRRVLISAKLAAASILVAGLYIVATIIFLILGVIFFGENGIGLNSVVIDMTGIVAVRSYIPTMVNAFIVNTLLVFSLVAITTLVAIIFKKQLFAVLIPLLIWNFGGNLVESINFIPKKIQFLFFLYPLDFFSSVGSWEISWSSTYVLQMTLSILIYSVLMILFSVVIFIRQSAYGGKLIYKT